MGVLRLKNYPQTTSEQLQNNFQKVQKTGFLTLKMVKMTLLEDQNLTVNFDFRDHIATFGAVNTPKRGPFIAENNASEQLLTNFQKVQKTYFLGPKNGQITGTNFEKWPKFKPKISILVVTK